MEQLEYITQKAMIQCSMGSMPGQFTPTYNQTVKINGCLASTKIDQIPMTNIPSFIVCKKTQKPCVPAPVEWKETYPVKVKGQETLIGKSCNKCPVGQGDITFMTSGQVPLSAEEQAMLDGAREDAQKAYEKEQEEKNKPWWKKAGEFIVDCVPVVGPVVSMVKNISEGNWGMALLDVGFLALDVVGVVGAPFTGGASLAGTTALKIGARQAIKAGAKQVAKKLTKEAIEAGAKQLAEMASKVSLKSLSGGRLCVFACFPAGTPVATKYGLKNIEDIQAGDEVWAYDEKTGEVGLKPVLHHFERTATILVTIKLEGETIRATPEHPFYANGEWKEAGLLETGDDILLFSGKLAKVKEVQYEGVHAPVEISNDIFEDIQEGQGEPQKVYNFEVAGWHTYFVGWWKALVHNTGGICVKQVIKEIRTGKKKLREILLGRTPGKSSKTGRDVFERMKNEVPPSAMELPDGTKMFKDSKGNWHDISKADMAHTTDAVTWWNQTGRNHGARSKEVRDWMRDSNNYRLDHYSINRSEGAKLGQRYSLPRRR
jgi:Pretoxin HINT domain/Domain of unknown function (DUF4280)/HNH/ENDO VII superfamily nuclease with conserved GHE residues